MEENKAITDTIPAVFKPLMQQRIDKVNAAIRPGLISLTWTSMNLELYFAQVRHELTGLERLIKQVCISSMNVYLNTSLSERLIRFEIEVNAEIASI